MKTNNILLIDYGNTLIKAAIFDDRTKEIVEIVQAPVTTNSRALLSEFRNLGDRWPGRIIETVTAPSTIVHPFNEDLKKQLKTDDLKILDLLDYKDYYQFPSHIVEMNVTIGMDIMALTFYLKQHLSETSAVFCLGTVYFALVMVKGQLIGSYFLPSIVKATNNIGKIAPLLGDDAPKAFDKQIGETTEDCLSAGGNLALEGWAEAIAKANGIDEKNIILTGGDVSKFANISKKYKTIDNLVLKAMAELVIKKGW